MKRLGYFFLLIIVFFSVFTIPSFADVEIGDKLPTKEDFDAKWNKIDSNIALTTETKGLAKTYYMSALSTLKDINDLNNLSKGFQDKLSTIDATIEKAKKVIDKPEVVFEETSETMSLDLEGASTLLKQVTASYIEDQRMLEQIKQSIDQRNARLEQINVRQGTISANRTKLLQSTINATSTDDVSDLNNKLMKIQLNRIDVEDKKLDLERQYLNKLADLLPLQQEDYARRVVYEKDKKDYLDGKVMYLQRQAAMDNLKRTTEQHKVIEQEFPDLKDQLAINEQILSDQTGDETPHQLVRYYQAKIVELKTLLKNIKQHEELIQRRIDVAGLDKEVGVHILEQLRNFPEPRELLNGQEKAKDDLFKIQRNQLRNNDLSSELADFQKLTNTIYQDVNTTYPKAAVIAVIKDILNERRDALAFVHEENYTLLQELIQINYLYDQVLTTIRQIRIKCSERLLWIQSYTPISAKTLKAAFQGFKQIYSVKEIKSCVKATYKYFIDNVQIGLVLIGLILFLTYMLLIMNRRMLSYLHSGKDSPRQMIKSMTMSLIYSLIIPFTYVIIMHVTANMFEAISKDGDILTIQLSWGFRIATSATWIWLLLLYLCRPNGPAFYFGWNNKLCSRIYRWSKRQFWIVLGIMLFFGSFLSAMELLMQMHELPLFHNQEAIEYNRLSYCILSIVLSLYYIKLFNPYYGLFGILNLAPNQTVESVKEKSGSKLFRLRCLQFIIVIMTLGIGLLISYGYELAGVCLYSLVTYGTIIFTLAAIVDSFMSVFLQQSKQHVINRIITRFRKFGKYVMSDSVFGMTVAGIELTGEEHAREVAEKEKKDLESAETLFVRIARTTRIVVWGVAVIILANAILRLAPAMDKIGNIELWRVKADTGEMITSSSSQAVTMENALDISQDTPAITSASNGTTNAMEAEALKKVKNVKIVTVYSLITAIVFLIACLYIARHVSDIIELVLSAFPITESARYGIKTMTSYCVAIVGFTLCLANLGVTWNNVQWIIAAASVGLGFGLKEIFANIVSGILILIERPIRVGDLVTVGNVTGNVLRISLRATIVRDFDYRELIVPNRQIIMNEIVNSSLTTPVMRGTIELSYHRYLEDPEKIMAELLETIYSVNGVLKEPAATVTIDHMDTKWVTTYHFVIYFYYNSSTHSILKMKTEFYDLANARFRECLTADGEAEN